MKRNFNVPVKNYDGKANVRAVFAYDAAGLPVVKENGEPKFSHHEPMTLRLYALDAIAGRWRGEDGMTVDEAYKRMKLHDKLTFAPEGVVELDTAEGQLILDCLLKQGRDPVVIGRMKDLLDTDPALDTVQA